MAKIRGTIVVNTERCKGCNLCVIACPKQIISLFKEVNRKGYNYAQLTDEEACIGCAACATVCPDGCIEVYKIKMDK
ncbi:MAG: 4Fe-4S binding protein [Bacteroidaceae bacterium]